MTSENVDAFIAKCRNIEEESPHGLMRVNIAVSRDMLGYLLDGINVSRIHIVAIGDEADLVITRSYETSHPAAVAAIKESLAESYREIDNGDTVNADEVLRELRGYHA